MLVHIFCGRIEIGFVPDESQQRRASAPVGLPRTDYRLWPAFAPAGQVADRSVLSGYTSAKLDEFGQNTSCRFGGSLRSGIVARTPIAFRCGGLIRRLQSNHSIISLIHLCFIGGRAKMFGRLKAANRDNAF